MLVLLTDGYFEYQKRGQQQYGGERLSRRTGTRHRERRERRGDPARSDQSVPRSRRARPQETT